MPLSRDSEQRIVQEPALEYLEQQGWQILNGWKENFPRDDDPSLVRPGRRSVLLGVRLQVMWVYFEDRMGYTGAGSQVPPGEAPWR